MKTYTRVPLAVDARFTAGGQIEPVAVYFGAMKYPVLRILSARHHCPHTVPCIAPIEYTVLIENIHKNIYYEADTALWFSIREEQK